MMVQLVFFRRQLLAFFFCSLAVASAYQTADAQFVAYEERITISGLKSGVDVEGLGAATFDFKFVTHTPNYQSLGGATAYAHTALLTISRSTIAASNGTFRNTISRNQEASLNPQQTPMELFTNVSLVGTVGSWTGTDLASRPRFILPSGNKITLDTSLYASVAAPPAVGDVVQAADFTEGNPLIVGSSNGASPVRIRDSDGSWLWQGTAELLDVSRTVTDVAEADFNLDGVVDMDDFLIWQSNDGTGSGSFTDPNNSAATFFQGDATRDGVINNDDFEVWQQLAVPEPNSLALGFGAILIDLFKRSKHQLA